MPILLYFLLAIHVIMCALIILVTLMQRPRSEGLGAAFGGGMTDNIFGAQTTNVLAKFTTWLGGLFFVVTLILAMLYARMGTGGDTRIQQELKNLPAPAAEASPAVPAAAATVAETPAAETVTDEPSEVADTAAPAVGEISSDVAAPAVEATPLEVAPATDATLPPTAVDALTPAPVVTPE